MVFSDGFNSNLNDEGLGIERIINFLTELRFHASKSNIWVSKNIMEFC